MNVYGSLKDARSEIQERVTYIRNHWVRTEVQLRIIERIWTSLGRDLRSTQFETLEVLETKLKSARDKLDGLVKKRPQTDGSFDQVVTVKRWKYLFLKSHLDDTIRSLDKWQRRHDISWYLIVRMAGPRIDEELAHEDAAQSLPASAMLETSTRIRRMLRRETRSTELFLPGGGFDQSTSHPVSCTTAKYLPRSGKSGYIVDSIQCTHGSHVDDMEKDIRILATKLQCVDPATFGVLKCKGVVRNKASNGSRVLSFDIIFSTPVAQAPRTLRSCLVSRVPHTLTERVDLAKQLARSVSYVHTLDFVHKNLRPENVVGFGTAKLGSFFLIGFEQVRGADGMTFYRGDADWHKNLYRHPERQGLHPEERYCMQHDMYSLGVCLLEIGLWGSFVLYDDDGKIKGPNVDLLGASTEQLRRKKPSAIKKLLVNLAQGELSSRMGNLYEEVVLSCLTCLDDDNMDFGAGRDSDASGDEGTEADEESDRSEEEAIGTKYIQKVCMRVVHLDRLFADNLALDPVEIG